MKISFVLMVKNESKHIEEVLKSIAYIKEKISSEIVVLDTGSTDNTVEIAKKYTDKVYFHEWNNDFASMRNKSISYANGEWLFILDGDEILSNQDSLIDFFLLKRDKEFNNLFVNIKNIIREEDNKYNIAVVRRLFRNSKNFKYVGAIHEQPKYQEPHGFLDLTLIHYGYLTTDPELMKRKFERNSELLHKQVEKEPENVYYLHQLFNTYGMNKDHDKALYYSEKAYEIAKKKNIDISKNMYIYSDLATALFNKRKYEEVETICKEAIKFKDGYIDFYYYLGKVQMLLGKNSEAISNYETYLRLVNNYNSNTIQRDITVTHYSIGFTDLVIYDLCILLSKEEEFKRVLQYSKNIKDTTTFKSTIPLVIQSYVELADYEGLLTFAKEEVANNKNNIKNYFYQQLETRVMNTKSLDEKWNIINVFADGESLYNYLNKIRIEIQRNNHESIKTYLDIINSINFSNLPNYYGDIIYYLLKVKYPIYDLLKEVNEISLNKYLKYLIERYDDLSETIYDYLQEFIFQEDWYRHRINKILIRFVLISNRLTLDKYKLLFKRYIQEGIKYIGCYYHRNIIEMEMTFDVKSDEDMFLIYLIRAEEKIDNDKVSYIKYLRKALKIYPLMKVGIEYLLEDIKNEEIVMNIETEKLKKHIDNLLSQNLLNEALTVVNEALTIIPNNLDFYSIKAIILLRLQKMNDAIITLEKGLVIDPNHIDTLYNLAFIYEQNDKIEEAIGLYRKVILLTNEDDLKTEIQNKMKKLTTVDSTVGETKNVLYLGWLGENNIGDDVLFELFELMYKKYNQNPEPVNIVPYSTKSNFKINIVEYDLIVLGGGSLLHLPYWLDLCSQAIKQNIPVVSWGTGIDGYYKREHLESIALSSNLINKYKTVYEKFNYISVRGPFTKNALLNSGVKIDVDEIGDPALIYASEIFEEQINRPKVQNKTILINWGTSYNNIFGKNEEQVENELVKVAKKLLADGYNITIYPIWTEDIDPVKRLGRKIDNSSCEIITEVYNAKRMQTLIQTSYLTINLKLHANILSASANVPFISLAYRGKCLDFAQSVNCSEYAIPTDEVNSKKILKLVKDIGKNYNSIIRRFEQAKEKYYTKVIKTISIISNYLSKEISSVLSNEIQDNTPEKMFISLLDYIESNKVNQNNLIHTINEFAKKVNNDKNKEFLDILSSLIRGYLNKQISEEVLKFYISKQFVATELQINRLYKGLNLLNKNNYESNMILDYYPKVSVIITTYNRKEFLKQSINSILSQSYPNIEIVVFDDHSTDGTDNMLLLEYNNISTIKFIKNEVNMGPGINRRVAFENYTDGEYILFLDDDDYLIDSRYISNAVSYHIKNQNVSFVAANVLLEFTKANIYKPSILNMHDQVSGKDYFKNFGKKGYPKPASTLTALFKRSSLIEMGILEMEMVNDVSIYLRSLLVGDAGFIDQIVGVYRVHGNNITFNLSSEFIIDNLEEKYKIKQVAISKYGYDIEEMDTWMNYNAYTTAVYYITNSAKNPKDVQPLYMWLQDKCPNVVKMLQ